jgi:hypothetical protein
MILHGSEEVTVHKPIKHDITYKVQEKILDIQDKGKMSVVIGQTTISDASNPSDIYSTITS